MTTPENGPGRLTLMKLKPEFVLLAALLLPFGALRASDPELAGALQKGLFEEEANHNLVAAKESYKEAIGKFDEERKLAATAVFRLGECYRKEGETAEANQQYERIVREFTDQGELVKSSQAALGPRAANAQPTFSAQGAAPSSESEEEAEIQRLTKFLQDSPDMINGDSGKDGMTPLQEAASKGQMRVAAWLLERKADINFSNPKGTALHIAVANGNLSLSEFLLSHGANPNRRGPKGKTPLHIASEKNFLSLCEVLLKNKADVNARDEERHTPLHFAKLAAAKLLLDNNADVEARDNQHFTALVDAAHAGDLEMVKLLLAHGAQINNPEGGLPLFWAIDRENKAMVELLLNNRADPNLCDQGTPMLSIALSKKNSDIASMLVAHGSDVNQRGSGGTPPLFCAIERDIPPMVELLLKSKADPNFCINGTPPLMFALQIKKARIAELLLAYGANVNKGSDGGSSLGDVFKYSDRIDDFALEFLLSHGADPNHIEWQSGSSYGSTSPLVCAIQAPITQTGSNSIQQRVELLLKYGADPNRWSSEGASPLNAAHNYPEIVELLRAHGGSELASAPGRIVLTRRDKAPFLISVFTQDTQGFNRYTLLDALHGFIFEFPDLSRVVIHRSSTGKSKEIVVNLLKPDQSLDLSKDLLLEFGDVIEIPERAHSLGETDGALSSQQSEQIGKHLNRTVTFISGSRSKEITLDSPRLSQAIFGGPSGASPSKGLLEFLPSTADLTRVQITRVDPATKLKIHYTANLARSAGENPGMPRRRRIIGDMPQPIVPSPERPPGNDQVWLLDGDVIEIPAS